VWVHLQRIVIEQPTSAWSVIAAVGSTVAALVAAGVVLRQYLYTKRRDERAEAERVRWRIVPAGMGRDLAQDGSGIPHVEFWRMNEGPDAYQHEGGEQEQMILEVNNANPTTLSRGAARIAARGRKWEDEWGNYALGNLPPGISEFWWVYQISMTPTSSMRAQGSAVESRMVEWVEFVDSRGQWWHVDGLGTATKVKEREGPDLTGSE
jgi:hypothetical protein